MVSESSSTCFTWDSKAKLESHTYIHTQIHTYTNLHWSVGLFRGDLQWPMSLPQRVVTRKRLYAWESPLHGQ